MSRVLVTGSTTPLGAALVKSLLDDERVEKVVAVGREGEPPCLAIEDDPRFVCVPTDLRRSRNVRNLLYGPARDVTAVVHGAIHRSAHHIGRRAHALNVDATRTMLELAEGHPHIERFVFVSSGAVYQVDSENPAIVDEAQPLNLTPRAPQWIRDRVEADLCVCTRMGMSQMKIVVLRFAECLAPAMGSQMYDYLNAPVCLRPLGFDPIMNVIGIDDMVASVRAGLRYDAHGLFNIPGRDTLPLTAAIRRWGKHDVPVPGFLMSPLYRLRARLERSEFRYDLNMFRFHFNAVLSGRRALTELGYEASHGIDWPVGGALPEPT